MNWRQYVSGAVLFAVGFGVGCYSTRNPDEAAYERGYEDGKRSQQENLDRLDKKQTELEKKLEQLKKD